MTTYSINLDDVDLALLPVRTRTYNDFLKKEHYQFSVMKEPVPELTSDINYTCHICAIEVPAAFAREHAASIKHRANARIASVAVQRTRALITALPPPAAAQTARFCANCATIADGGHDKTKEHRVAAMHDNLLWELMKAYVGDGELKNDQYCDDDNILNSDQGKGHIVLTSKDDEDNNKNYFVNRTIDKNQNDITTKHSELKAERTPAASEHPRNVETKDNIIENKDKPLDKVAITNNINKIENNQSIKPVTEKVLENGTSQNEPTIINEASTSGLKTKLTREPYEKELRKFMNLNSVFQIKEIYHRVHIRINDDTVNVYSDHFHSFHRMYNNGKVECIVCSKTFEEKDTESHKYDLNHMTAVANIGHDGNYVREINKTHSHCIICNQKINNTNIAKHKQSQHHTLRKSNNVKTNATNTKEPTTASSNNVDTDQTELNHKAETMKETVEINKHPYKEVSGRLHCVVCECQVPRDLRNREDHLKGLRHVNNLKTKASVT